MAISGSSLLAAILPGVMDKLLRRRKGQKVSTGEIARAAITDALEGATQSPKTSAAGLATLAGALNLEAAGIDPSSLEGLVAQAIMYVVAALLVLYRQRTS